MRPEDDLENPGQLDLILQEQINVIARQTDPETSHEAAAAFESNQTKAQRSVMTVVRILKEHAPLSDFEIRDQWEVYWGSGNWSYTLPCKARHWARERGLVKHEGYGSHEGRRVRTWALGDDRIETMMPCCPTCQRPLTKKQMEEIS